MAGLAIFAMFFGAGNIIFPLALGQQALDQLPWGLCGLLLTAVAMPFAGLIAMFRYEGQAGRFFSRIGAIPGLTVAFFTISVLGPLGAAPRCIALAHSTMSISWPGIPLILFSALACSFIFLFACRENRLLKLIGYFLSPIKITLLVLIIIKGFMEAPEAVLTSIDTSKTSHFSHGLIEGYHTMDLLAAFFFAPIIISSLSGSFQDKQFRRFVLKASSIGALLLAAIYVGFGYLAYLYASQLEGIPNDKLLGTVAIHVLGPHAGFIVSLTVAIACLTTAIALIAAFANFIHREIFREKISHVSVLLFALALTFAITTLEFQGIVNFLSPILEICYPLLIALTFYNLFAPRKTISQHLAGASS